MAKFKSFIYLFFSLLLSTAELSAQCVVDYNSEIFIDSLNDNHLFITLANCEIDSFEVLVLSKFGKELFRSNNIDFQWYPDKEPSKDLLPVPQYVTSIFLREKRGKLKKYGGHISVK